MKLLQCRDVVDALIKESDELLKNMDAFKREDVDCAMKLQVGLLWVAKSQLETELNLLNLEEKA